MGPYEGPPGQQCYDPTSDADIPARPLDAQLQILARLNDALGDSGGAYSAANMPPAQAIQYSLIALAKQTTDALTPLIQVLAHTIVARVEWCEQVLESLARPRRALIRKRIKGCEQMLGELLQHLGGTITARTSHCQAALAHCQACMLGATEQPETIEDTGILDGGGGTGDVAGTLPTPATTDSLVSVQALEPTGGDRRPIIVQLSVPPAASAPANACCPDPLAALIHPTDEEIVLALRHEHPAKELARIHGYTPVDGSLTVDVGAAPSPIEDEEFPLDFFAE